MFILKGLSLQLTPLDATLTENTGGGTLLTPPLRDSAPPVPLPPHCSAQPLVQQFAKARDFFTIRGNNSAPPGVYDYESGHRELSTDAPDRKSCLGPAF